LRIEKKENREEKIDERQEPELIRLLSAGILCDIRFEILVLSIEKKGNKRQESGTKTK